MVKVFDINSIDERKQFEIKLQIALLNNTLKIQKIRKNTMSILGNGLRKYVIYWTPLQNLLLQTGIKFSTVQKL